MNRTARKILLFLLSTAMSATTMAQTIDTVQLKKRVDPILSRVEAQPDWLASRLMMFWQSHATDVLVKGEYFEAPSGDRAPVPTVKMNGARSYATSYKLPALEDIIPYDDDEEGRVTMINSLTGEMEKVHLSKTGCSMDSQNRRVLDLARDAARLYTATGRTAYADMALHVMDVYLKGIYYRDVPRDITKGHMQTHVGMQTFEVIHEDALVRVCEIYKRLYDYITADKELYDAALKKWAENIIDNGVPHNNWDLFQATFIAEIALVLQPDSHYADKRGREYYLDYIVNQTSVRQWSMRELAGFGFDSETATWYESPGYSVTVLNEFATFAEKLDREAGIDLFDSIPILLRAIETSPQYLAPNRMIVGFGDTHPDYLKETAVNSVLAYAERHNNTALTERFQRLKSVIQKDADEALAWQYVTPSFYAPNVSWLVQRTGMNPEHDLMISPYGSLGNLQQANGISMELYGKGWMLGPDAGIGKSLYSGDDYKEYYSQFPAHNTVCVDGISSYPVMMSSHAFKVDDRFPETNDDRTQVPATYSQVSFMESETQAEQVRTNGIVRTSATGGYYVDIFHSRKTEGGDKYHDYFYHNLGQKMRIVHADTGEPLDLHPTDQLAFAGGNLYAYSYIYDKMCDEPSDDVKTTFAVNDSIFMTMWMKGEDNRKIVQALSPANLEYERMKQQPYDIESQPVLTFIARQRGEAWTRPFVAVYEPSTASEPSEIETVEYFRPESSDTAAIGIAVHLKNGQTDYIFSSVTGADMKYKGMEVKGHYAVVSPRFTLSNNKIQQK